MLDSLINGVFGVGTALFGANQAKKQQQAEQNFNAEQAQLNRDFQREERLATQEYNLDMWNRTNEYNSLSSQIQRAKAAGVSPNTLFSNGSPSNVANPVAASSPMSGTPTAASPSIANGLFLQNAQVANLLAQTDLLDSQAENERYNLHWNQITQNERFANMQWNNKKQEAEIKKYMSDIGVNDFNMDLQERTFQWFSKHQEQDLKIKNAQLIKLYNDNESVIKDIKLKDAQIDKTKAETDKIYAETEKTKAETTGIGIDNAIKDIEKTFCEITQLPLGAPEEHVLFKLWQSGDWNNFSNYVELSGMNHDRKHPVSLSQLVGRGISAFREGMAQSQSRFYQYGGWKGIINRAFERTKSIFNPH